MRELLWTLLEVVGGVVVGIALVVLWTLLQVVGGVVVGIALVVLTVEGWIRR